MSCEGEVCGEALSSGAVDSAESDEPREPEEASVPENNSSESVIMRIDCPQCGQTMFVRVGLSPETAINQIECVNCRHFMVALVPDPVIGRPWKADSDPPSRQ